MTKAQNKSLEIISCLRLELQKLLAEGQANVDGDFNTEDNMALSMLVSKTDEAYAELTDRFNNDHIWIATAHSRNRLKIG